MATNSGSGKVLNSLTTKEVKNLDSLNDNNLGSEKLTIKRSYTLRESTVQMLGLLQSFGYESPDIQLNNIVDDAIRNLYKEKKDKINEGIKKVLSENLLEIE